MRINVELYTDTMLCLKYLLDTTEKKINSSYSKLKNKNSIKAKRLKAPREKIKYVRYEFIFKLDQLFMYENLKLFTLQTNTENRNLSPSLIFRINFFDIINSSFIYFLFDSHKNDKNSKIEEIKSDDNDITIGSQDSQNQVIFSTQIFKSEPRNDNVNDFVFKTPHQAFIDCTQEFAYLAPTQYFCFEPLNQSDFSKNISLDIHESLESDLVETQILEDDSISLNFKSETKKSKLIKKKSSEKILQRKFINFNPNYNNLNPSMDHTGIFSSQPAQSQLYCSKISTQLSLNLTPAKPIKKKSFITIGLSKKQKIKNHLHNV